MTDILSNAAALPMLLLLCAASLLFFRHSASRTLYLDGIRSGLSSLKELVAPMLMLCISVRMITACGLCDGISELLLRLGIGKYVPASLLPLIITRPLSGSAANASLAELIERCGVGSFEVFCAAVIMSSGDTCFYIYSTYFSVQTPKKGGIVLTLMLLASLFSVIICIFVCNLRFFT